MENEYIITQEDLEQGNSYLQALTTEHPVCRIADGVTEIKDHTFEACMNLTNIIIPYGVTSIGYFAFYHCDNLTNIVIPDSVTHISNSAFFNCISIINIVIPNGVTYIEDDTFAGCKSLLSVVIPDSITIIGNNVFAFSKLTDINYKGTKEQWNNITKYDWNSNCPENVVINYNYGKLISKQLSDYVMAVVNGTSLIITGSGDIPEKAYIDCTELTKLIIEDGITKIGQSAFFGCKNLTNVSISDTVNSIQSSAFEGCSSLENITIPNSVTSIGSDVFEDCTNLQTINVDLNFNQTLLEGKVPSNTKILINCTGDELRDKLFTYDSSIYTRIINDTTHEGFYADENAGTISIHNVTITNNLLTQLFYPWSDSITEIDLSGVDLSRVRIFDALFQDCHALETVDLSNWNITTDETVNLVNMFAGSGIKNVILPNLKVKYIDGMFSNCYMLEELDLSNLDVSQVTRMDRLFENCSKLKTLNLTGWDTSKVEDMSSMFEGCEGFDSLKM